MYEDVFTLSKKMLRSDERTGGDHMCKGVYQVAISAYITFRGEDDSEEEYVDRIFDELRDFLENHPNTVDLETKIDYSREVVTRPPLPKS